MDNTRSCLAPRPDAANFASSSSAGRDSQPSRSRPVARTRLPGTRATSTSASRARRCRQQEARDQDAPAVPEEVAAVALHLASDESAFTTGITCVVDGGFTL
jgi:2-keto-3-deoxy-L-fuconate dehydrogenase